MSCEHAHIREIRTPFSTKTLRQWIYNSNYMLAIFILIFTRRGTSNEFLTLSGL